MPPSAPISCRQLMGSTACLSPGVWHAAPRRPAASPLIIKHTFGQASWPAPASAIYNLHTRGGRSWNEAARQRLPPLVNVIEPETVHNVLTALIGLSSPIIDTRKTDPRDWRLIKLAENGQLDLQFGNPVPIPTRFSRGPMQAIPNTTSLRLA